MNPPVRALLSPLSKPIPDNALRNALRVVLVFVAFGAAGCSTQSVAERSAACSATDWREYGLTDGRLGVPSGERLDYFEACRKLGVAVDVAAYEQGRQQGLAAYCTAETGYDVGREGRRYRDVCSGQAEIAFRQGYEQGRRDRPRYGYGYPGPRIGVGVGIGSGGHTRTGVGIGFPVYYGSRYGRGGFYDDDAACFRSPYPCDWHRGDFWGF